MFNSLLGEIVAVTEVAMVITVIALALFGSKTLSERAFGSFAGSATAPNHQPRTESFVTLSGLRSPRCDRHRAHVRPQTPVHQRQAHQPPGHRLAKVRRRALAARIPLVCSPPGAGQQLLGCPALASYGTAACSLANSALSWRASAFSLALDPLTPPLRSARRVTGLPAVTSLRATKDA
jgi:hypothetical protein